MDNSNRIIVASYLSLTGLILLFTTLYGNGSAALYLKFGVRAAMVVTTIVLARKSRFALLLTMAFASSLFSDYFFVVLRELNPDLPNRNLYGIVGFIVA